MSRALIFVLLDLIYESMASSKSPQEAAQRLVDVIKRTLDEDKDDDPSNPLGLQLGLIGLCIESLAAQLPEKWADGQFEMFTGKLGIDLAILKRSFMTKRGGGA